MKKQIVLLGGGKTFDTQEAHFSFLTDCDRDLMTPLPSRKSWLCDSVAGVYDCIRPQMPNPMSAEYHAWAIRFEKYFMHLNDELVVVGHSLGALFLLKRLSENTLPVQCSQLHLVSPVIDTMNLGSDSSLNDFILNTSLLPHLSKQIHNIFIYHSYDDSIVPVDHSLRLSAFLPSAKLELFQIRGHFHQPAFPELLENIGVYQRNI